jgi:hypothetical protein
MSFDELMEYSLARLKDIATKNRLTGGETEHNQADIKSAYRQALININGGVFNTGYTLETCPPDLLIRGTVIELLQQDISLKARNQIAANDGGILLDREGNIALYMNIMEREREEFRDALQKHKGFLNLREAML